MVAWQGVLQRFRASASTQPTSTRASQSESVSGTTVNTEVNCHIQKDDPKLGHAMRLESTWLVSTKCKQSATYCSVRHGISLFNSVGHLSRNAYTGRPYWSQHQNLSAACLWRAIKNDYIVASYTLKRSLLPHHPSKRLFSSSTKCYSIYREINTYAPINVPFHRASQDCFCEEGCSFPSTCNEAVPSQVRYLSTLVKLSQSTCFVLCICCLTNVFNTTGHYAPYNMWAI